MILKEKISNCKLRKMKCLIQIGNKDVKNQKFYLVMKKTKLKYLNKKWKLDKKGIFYQIRFVKKEIEFRK